MSEILIVPGLAVRSYALAPAQALRERGHHVHLLRPPAWHGAPTDLQRYGEMLAQQVAQRGQEISLLVGLSVGAQAAAAAAAESHLIQRMLLVSPTVDPRERTFAKLLRAWMFGPKAPGDPSFLSQVPDWAHAGIPRILAGFRSALRVPIERLLPDSGARLTIVHAENDQLGTAAWAEGLAWENHGQFILRRGAPHSWPIEDAEGFADFVETLLNGSLDR